ncbi:transcriptional regulator [Microbacterium sp. Root53]|uniref:TetR/AcrR family transcriptional regulator n=1 Tax=Microbacterium sp. Root53 TaxID=1736553 RepID=UPI0006FDC5AF|nr:TetR/AcrR family transcriptional regulator [Microbacterium sp. Root53]KQZ11811.1 transcriptional regulator [Microbacterium sp. Root53]
MPFRGPGRPRAAGLDERVVAAALELIDAELPVTAGRLVERSGVSRAAIYRRWPSLADLVAAALDRGREPLEIPIDGDLRSAIFESFLGGAERQPSTYSDERMRQRLRLALADRALQRAYWDAHVSRRRVATLTALRAGIDRGVLRDDLDVEACVDLLGGVFYYQLVVRGVPMTDADALARCRAAFDVVWRGMAAGSA